MCLQTTWKKSKIAEKNITVYKLLNVVRNGKQVRLFSEFKSFSYKLNTLYKTRMLYTDEYTAYDSLAGDARNNTDEPFKSIGQGFHSALTKKRLSSNISSGKKIVKCIIPKGARYFEGLSGLAVSSQIKVIEILK